VVASHVRPTAPELAEAVAALLDSRLVACAESCTAGRVSAELAAVGGASSWFQGGLVAYRSETKRALLGVTASSVLTELAAIEMAVGVRQLLAAKVAVATTGVMGDEPEEGVPPGTVIVATVIGGDVRMATHHQRASAPEDRCAGAVATALEALLRHLQDEARARFPAR
jgi:PncC family amidohydrolase